MKRAITRQRLRPPRHTRGGKRADLLGAVLGVALMSGLVALILVGGRAKSARSSRGAFVGPGIPTRVEDLLKWETMDLTQEQIRAKAEALATIPAPCCHGYTLAMRCCGCTLSRALSGLSNYLVSRGQHDPARLREAVLKWIRDSNPNGYGGRACKDRRCRIPFDQDGCGGMAGSGSHS